MQMKIFHLFHGEKVIFDEMMIVCFVLDKHALLNFYSAYSLEQ